MRVLLNGAEPVDPDTMIALADAGARFGLDPLALAPTYGMAEVTLAVSVPEPGRGLVVDRVDPDLLEAGGLAVRSTRANARAMATLGPLVPGLEGRVVARDGLTCAEAEARVNSQMPMQERNARATHAIDTDRPIERTRAELEQLYRAALKRAEELDR